MTAGKSQTGDLDGIKTHDEDPFLNISTVGRALGKHRSTIRDWIDSGILKAERVGKLDKVRKSTLIRLLEGSALGEDLEILERVDGLEGDDDNRGPERDQPTNTETEDS
jgi:excisionase family DNA binding protein